MTDRPSGSSARIALVVLSCLASAVTGLVLSRGGGASPAASGGRVLIGLSMDTLQEERWQNDRDHFVARAKELGADVLVQAANSDDARQMRDVESLISSGVRVLVIVPHNAAAMARAVEKAHEAGIPVLSYDRLITGADVDLYVSFAAVDVGKAQAQYLVDRLPAGRTLRVVRINGAKTDHNAVLVRDGQELVLKPHVDAGRLEIVHEDWAFNWKPDAAKKIVNAAITRLGADFDAVLAANDGTAGGAIQALTEEGLAGKVLVTGQDGELAACQRIAAGTQHMTVYKPVKLLGRLSAEMAYKLALGKPVVAAAAMDNGKAKVPTIALDVVQATKDNLMDTVIADGYQKYDDVYRGVPADKRPKR